MLEYTVNGELYNVPEDLENKFLEKYPNAVKVETSQPGKIPPQVPGAPVETTAAPDMASKSEDTSLELQEINNEEKRKLPFLVRNELSTSGLPFTRENVDSALAKHKARTERPISEAIKEDVDKAKKDINIAKQSFSNIVSNFYNEDLVEDDPFVAALSSNMPMLQGQARFFTSPRLKRFYTSISYGTLEMLDNLGFDLDKSKAEVSKEFLEAEKRTKQVVGLTDVKGPATLLAAITGAGSEVGFSIATGLASGGYLPMAEMIGGMVTNYNVEKAKSKYKDLSEEDAVEQLIKDKDTDFWLPTTLAVPAALAERYALKGTTKFLTKNIASSGKKEIAKSILINSNKEGGTEWIQGALETATSSLGANYDLEIESVINGVSVPTKVLKSAQDAFDFAFSKQGLETYLQGLVGTGVISSSKAAIDKLGPDAYRALATTRYVMDEGKVEKLTDEIADLIEKKNTATNPEMIKIFEEQIQQKEQELKGQVINQAGFFDAFEEEDYDEIKDASKLSRAHVEKVNELRQDLNDGIIDESEYNELYNNYKDKYKQALNRIKNVVDKAKENISQKNIDISNKNEELFGIITNPESKPSQIDRARNEIALNNMGLVNNLINSKFNPATAEASGFTRDMFESAVYEEYSKLINTYNPESGVPFGAYLKQNLPKRLPRIFEQGTEKAADGGFVFKEDVSERRDIMAEESDIEVVKQEASKSMTKDLSMPADLVSEIETGVASVLATKLPPVSDPKFVKELSEAFKNKFTEIVKEQFGKKKEEFRQYLIDNFDTLFDQIPQEAFNKRLPGMFEAVTDETGRQVRERTAVGKGVFKKAQMTPEQFADYFTGEDVYASLASNRKVKLAEIVAQELGKDATAKVILNPEVATRFRQTQELLGQEVPGGFERSIALAIKRLDQLSENLEKFREGKLFSGPLGMATFIVEVFAKTLSKLLKRGMGFNKAVDAAAQKTVNDLGIESLFDKITSVFKSIFKKPEDATEENAEKAVNAVTDVLDKALKEKLPVIVSNFNKSLENLSVEQKIEKLKIFYDNVIKPLKETTTKSIVDFTDADATLNWMLENIPNIKDKNIQYKTEGSGSGKSIVYITNNISKKLSTSPLGPKTRDTINKKGSAKNILDYLYSKTAARDIGVELKNKSNIQVISDRTDKNINSLTVFITDMIESGRIDELLLILRLQKESSISPLRLSARLKYIQSDFDSSLEDKSTESIKQGTGWTYEHVTTTETTYQALKEEILAGRTEKIREILEKGVAAYISTKIANQKINKTDYKQSNGPNFNILTDDPLERLTRFDIKVEPIENKIKIKDPVSNKETTVSDARSLRPQQMIEAKTGGQIKATQVITKSEAKALERTRKKFFRGIISPGADDAHGLVQDFYRKGKLGEEDHTWFKENFFDLFDDASIAMNKNTIAKQRHYENIRKKHKQTFKTLKEKVMGPFDNDMILRVYLYTKAGVTAEQLGLSQSQVNDMMMYVNDNTDLLDLANDLRQLNSGEEFWIVPEDPKNFTAGRLANDISEILNKKDRQRFFEKFNEAKDAIFSDDFMNKVEAVYGKEFRNALGDALYRMETGRSRSSGVDPQVGALWNWFRGSVGVTMFFHTRSAILQTISFSNYIDLENNNLIAASKAFADQRQFWEDFMFLMKSEYLAQRRGGLSTEINMQDLADDLNAGGAVGTRSIISKLLQVGFSFTQAGDAFAISFGGASYYRNQVNAYLKQGLTEEQAQEKAFRDFVRKTEESQQSSRPDRLSKQQVSMFGKLFLAFQNITGQMTRIQTKEIKDVLAGRGNKYQKLSRVAYYFTMQNIMFSVLQNAIFAFMFPDDEEEEELLKTKTQRVINNSLDTILRGTGVYGAVVAMVKNATMEFIEQERRSSEGKGRADHMYTMIEIANVSAPIGIKARKIGAMIDSYRYNKGVHERMGADIDNPALDIIANGVSVGANIPADRILNKIRNIKAAHDEQTETLHKILLLAGWNTWDLGVSGQREKAAEVKKQIRSEKSKTKKAKKLEGLSEKEKLSIGF